MDSDALTRDPQRDPPARTKIRAGAGAVGAVGLLPSTTVGAMLLGEVERGHLRVGMEGRVLAPVTVNGSSGVSARASTVQGALVPCLVKGVFGLCGVTALGMLSADGTGRTVRPRTDSSAYLTAGARASLDLPLGFVDLRVSAELLAAVTRTGVIVGSETLWTNPPLTAALMIAPVFTF
jgi:hypothetical protein